MNKNVNPKEWLQEISEKSLYKLAKKNLIRTGKAKKVKFGELGIYDFDPVQVILEGLLIKRKANKARIRI
jgi:hypothetical protein